MISSNVTRLDMEEAVWNKENSRLKNTIDI